MTIKMTGCVSLQEHNGYLRRLQRQRVLQLVQQQPVPVRQQHLRPVLPVPRLQRRRVQVQRRHYKEVFYENYF
jgi:hypothetical protein